MEPVRELGSTGCLRPLRLRRDQAILNMQREVLPGGLVILPCTFGHRLMLIVFQQVIKHSDILVALALSHAPFLRLDSLRLRFSRHESALLFKYPWHLVLAHWTRACGSLSRESVELPASMRQRLSWRLRLAVERIRRQELLGLLPRRPIELMGEACRGVWSSSVLVISSAGAHPIVGVAKLGLREECSASSSSC